MNAQQAQLRIDWLTRRMRQCGMRLTVVRRVEVEVLCEADGPIPIQGLYERVAQRVHTDLSTVYRFINGLLEAGLVVAQKMPTSDLLGYSVQMPGDSKDFVTCLDCGSFTRLDELKELRDLEERLARELHFQGLSHELRLAGRCEPCQQAMQNKSNQQTSGQ